MWQPANSDLSTRGLTLLRMVGRLPELRELKQRLQQESDGAFDAVFMTGSGSTMVGIGSQQVCRTRADMSAACGAHDLYDREHSLCGRNMGAQGIGLDFVSSEGQNIGCPQDSHHRQQVSEHVDMSAVLIMETCCKPLDACCATGASVPVRAAVQRCVRGEGAADHPGSRRMVPGAAGSGAKTCKPGRGSGLIMPVVTWRVSVSCNVARP